MDLHVRMNNYFVQRMQRQRKEREMETVITDEGAAMTLAVCLAETDKLGRSVEFHYQWAML